MELLDQQEINRGLITSNIQKIMSDKKMSTSDLAAKLGMRPEDVDPILSGGQDFSLDMLTSITHHLGVGIAFGFPPYGGA